MSVIAVAVAAAMVSGCARSTPGAPQAAPALPSASSAVSPTPPPSPTPPRSSPSPAPAPAPGQSAPAAGAPVEEVIAWVDAGVPADRAQFSTAEDFDGHPVALGSDVAFRSPGPLGPRTAAGCMSRPDDDGSDRRAVSCLIPLGDAPPRPAGLQGQWIGNWVDLTAGAVSVGGLHGDPGVFNQGRGRPLPYGQQLAFGDYQCRSDPAGLYCVNRPNHWAVLLGRTLVTFGCTVATDHPRWTGRLYDCRR